MFIVDRSRQHVSTLTGSSSDLSTINIDVFDVLIILLVFLLLL